MTPYTIPDPRNNSETLPLVLVEWLDASGDNAWTSFYEILNERPILCFVVGFLIEDTEEYLTVVSLGRDDLSRGADRTTIPKTWQVKITPLGVINGTV